MSKRKQKANAQIMMTIVIVIFVFLFVIPSLQERMRERLGIAISAADMSWQQLPRQFPQSSIV